jgi:hypothetical protein
MPQGSTIATILDDGSEVVINSQQIAYIRFVPAAIGGKAHAEIFFAGREAPLGIGEGALAALRSAVSGSP